MKQHFFIGGLMVGLFLVACSPSAPNGPFPAVQDSAAFPATAIVPTLEEDVDWTKNILYCPTLCLAWQDLKDTLPQPLLIDAKLGHLKCLHESQGHLGALEERDYEKKVTIEGRKVRIEVAFKANLLLATPLQINPILLDFKGQQVACFGGYGADTAVTQQVKLLFYESNQEFALALSPKEEGEELILYKTEKKKGRSLEALYDALTHKIARYQRKNKANKNAWIAEDVVAIPTLALNINKKYKRLIDLPFRAGEELYTIKKAEQRIGLVLNQAGALVESEAEVEVSRSLDAQEPFQSRRPLQLVFDSDFLLVTQKSEGTAPYLLAWVSTPEWMQLVMN